MMTRFLAGAATIFILSAPAVSAQTPVTDATMLNTLGYATGQAVLLTHLVVGTLADAYNEKAYTQDRATTFVNTYIGMTTGMKDQLRKLLDARSLASNDSLFVQHTIDTLDLVLGESGDLKNYIMSGAHSDAVAYDTSRQKALAAIKVLLSIKD